LPFNVALEYDIRKVQEKQVGLKWNGKYQLLVYADVVQNVRKVWNQWEFELIS
jgi:hypothetical protein